MDPDLSSGANLPPCSLPRRLAAISYDAILLLSVWFLATLALMPLTGGRAIVSGNLFYDFYLVGLAYVYFGLSWVRGGQTVGMRAWRVRLVRTGGTVNWLSVTMRFLASILSWSIAGLGFVWAAVDKEKLALHDRLSRTRLVLLPNE